MAIYKLFPEKDATIYSGFPVMNTGIDEILEVSTFYDTTSPEVSRFLIQFSQTEIEDVLDNRVGSLNFKLIKNIFSRCYRFKSNYYFRSLSYI
jgi:hypothetical protein